MFAFRLCLALGVIHPDKLLPRLSSRQLAEWMAYFDHCPFGQEIIPRQLAQIAADAFNRSRGSGESTRQPKEYLPYYREPQMTPEEIKTTLRRILHGNR